MKKFKASLIIIFLAFTSASFGQEPGKLLRRYLEEVINEHKPHVINEIFAEKYMLHILTDNVHVEKTRAELIEFLDQMFKSMPDIQYTIGDVIQEKNKAVIRAYANATHRGEMFGYAGTGNKIQNLSEIFFCEVKDGKIVDFSTQIDWHNLFRQIKEVQPTK